MPGKKRTAPETQQFAVEQLHRTIRLFIICSAVVICVWKLSDAAVKLANQPTWLSVVLTVVALIVPPGVLFPYLARYIGRWTEKNLARQSKNEEKIDPRRTSSGLTPKGADPEEAK